MGKSIVYIAISTFAIFMIVLLSVIFIEVGTIVTLANRVENSVVAAGWAGFSEIDFERMAVRTGGITDQYTRDIYLNKSSARDVVEQYLRQNLKLDSSNIPTEQSYIINKDNPVIFDEITIYNPTDLPATASNGNVLTRTTIHIVLRIPLDIKHVGFRYATKSVFVDIDSFNN